MVKANFKASNKGEGEYREVQIFDNVDKIAAANSRYIEDLKTARDAQTQLDSQYIQDQQAALKRGLDSQTTESKFLSHF